MTFAGRRVLITGGGSGLGADMARSFASAGAEVVIAGRRIDALQSVAKSSSSIRVVSADVASEDSVKAMFAAAGPCDIVIANAGAADSAAFGRTSLTQWNDIIAVNLTGTFLTFREGLNQIPGWGRLIAIASIAGLKGFPYVAPYAAAKHGVVGLVRSLALEVARTAGPEGLVVVLLPDTGERYLSKVHSDEWMRDNYLLDPAVTRVADVAPAKGRPVPKLLSVQASDALRESLTLIEKYDVNQIPVFRGTDVVGTLYDSDVLKAVLQDASVLDRAVESMMEAPLPVVSSDVPVGEVARLLATGTPAVLVRHGGAVTGILTRFDMLQFIVGGQ